MGAEAALQIHPAQIHPELYGLDAEAALTDPPRASITSPDAFTLTHTPLTLLLPLTGPTRAANTVPDAATLDK